MKHKQVMQDGTFVAFHNFSPFSAGSWWWLEKAWQLISTLICEAKPRCKKMLMSNRSRQLPPFLFWTLVVSIKGESRPLNWIFDAAFYMYYAYQTVILLHTLSSFSLSYPLARIENRYSHFQLLSYSWPQGGKWEFSNYKGLPLDLLLPGENIGCTLGT